MASDVVSDRIVVGIISAVVAIILTSIGWVVGAHLRRIDRAAKKEDGRESFLNNLVIERIASEFSLVSDSISYLTDEPKDLTNDMSESLWMRNKLALTFLKLRAYLSQIEQSLSILSLAVDSAELSDLPRQVAGLRDSEELEEIQEQASYAILRNLGMAAAVPGAMGSQKSLSDTLIEIADIVAPLNEKCQKIERQLHEILRRELRA